MYEERSLTQHYVPEVLSDGKRSVTVLMPQPVTLTDEPFVDGMRLIEQCMPALLQGLSICLKGPPGCGKTALVHALVKTHWPTPLYCLQGHNEQEAQDLGCRPRLSVDPEGRLVASQLMAAMIHGGLFYYDEIAKAPERALSLLASVLDGRQTIDSDVAGLNLKAKPSFRFIATVNPEDRELSTFIKSRMPVKIAVTFPSSRQLCRMVSAHFSTSQHSALFDAFKDWAADKENITPRDAVAIIKWADGKRQFEKRATLTALEAGRLVSEAAAVVMEGV